ncbi:MAG: hypothetical protein K5776_09875 [Lachnospiraceae bacterium]|nr:hypothetical protein [Lachnospiraceae bacterium]
MKKIETREAAVYVIMGIISLAAIACIVTSMVTNEATPFLGLGLALGGLGNTIGLLVIRNKKGNENGSGKDRSIS